MTRSTSQEEPGGRRKIFKQSFAKRWTKSHSSTISRWRTFFGQPSLRRRHQAYTELWKETGSARRLLHPWTGMTFVVVYPNFTLHRLFGELNSLSQSEHIAPLLTALGKGVPKKAQKERWGVTDRAVRLSREKVSIEKLCAAPPETNNLKKPRGKG